jgi:hypothetical protein
MPNVFSRRSISLPPETRSSLAFIDNILPVVDDDIEEMTP